MTPSDPRSEGGARSEEEQPRVVVRDKRRIDPTGSFARPAPAEPGTDASGPGPDGPVLGAEDDLTRQLAERTEDLKRVSAEYSNYRRRVDRDRMLIVEQAQERLVTELFPLLDDIDRAREHGDLTGAFKKVGDGLVALVERIGVEVFGQPGDHFDPSIHEAVLHEVSPDVSVPTARMIMRCGYRRGERILRSAMVAVAEPEHPVPRTDPESAESASAATPSGAVPDADQPTTDRATDG